MYIRLSAWQTQRVIVECQFDILPCESAAAFARGKANAAHFGSEGRTTRGCALNRGVVLEVNSRCKNLLEFQALQGFARLSEATIRKVCEEMKWTISASPTGADEDHHLAVVGMLNLDTSLTEEEVVQRILHRQESDKLTPEADDQELEMIVRDTLLSGEQDQALKELTRRRDHSRGQEPQTKGAKDVPAGCNGRQGLVGQEGSGSPQVKGEVSDGRRQGL